MTDLAVIMSVYQNDKLKYLAESVQSILDQTFTQFDYYIVFDGPVSSDIENYIQSKVDNRIRLFRLDKNQGLAGALNFLLEKVMKNPEYRFIARMDADDISYPSRIEKQRNFLLENIDVSCVGCWYQEIDEMGKHLSDRKLPINHESLKKRFTTRIPFAHPSVLYRRQLIKKAGYYPTDTILMEDNVLWGRALLQGFRFANIPEYLFKFRKDKLFYKRRSGVKYGWRFVRTRFEILRSLDSPISSYIITFITGVLKMMPSCILRSIYKLTNIFEVTVF
jgi:glycosyltransferase involved in cell wall biosynthesis